MPFAGFVLIFLWIAEDLDLPKAKPSQRARCHACSQAAKANKLQSS